MGIHGSYSPNDPALAGSDKRIGIVVCRFNETICEGLFAACARELSALGVTKVERFSIPGALEAPLALQKLAQSGRYDALVAIGCVIRGDTYHFEIVCNESARGILDVQLETGVPIANVILTVESEEQAHARISEKGSDGARVAVEMANLMKRV
ncbi:MAG: 6,7-dimethyl-8-ribityllumazine synthase [Thiobacillus sp.]|nr:6,7-dimethyl-8-ribityllumazine synthase [Thiobacillus sp.]